jgi:uroporphyrin-III C-methyltransferase / precorrin-2 dehydrogenase / sirohydrochlorin ferrochelatase
LSALLPLFLKLANKQTLVVGGGSVAAQKVAQLLAADARVTVVSPSFHDDILNRRERITLLERPVQASDIDGAWFVVAAATPEVNRFVADAAEARRVWSNVVDDIALAQTYFASTLRRGALTVAVSTDGEAPALSALVRQALESLIPEDIASWIEESKRLRPLWRAEKVPFTERRPLLLRALNALYEKEAP